MHTRTFADCVARERGIARLYFYALRFIVGVLEAGLSLAVILNLDYRFADHNRAKAVGPLYFGPRLSGHLLTSTV